MTPDATAIAGMPLEIPVGPIVLGLIVVVGAALWSRRFGALARVRDRSAVSGTGRTLPVSIIVPARNEAHNLPALLGSLRALDPAPLEILVVDDHSTDGTGAIAAGAGARVISPPPLPAGWNGKPWACRTGAAEARGEYLLFTDADTVHAPDSLGRAMARLAGSRAAMLSVVPTHIVRAVWERFQGVFQLLLLVATRAGAPERATAGAGREHERRFSIGQYLLFRRDAYERIGGHEPVRQRIAEDLAFARLIHGAGLPLALVFAPGMLCVRMYPEGLGAFVRGWRRNFREGLTAAGAGGVLEMVAVIGWLLGVPLAALSAAPTALIHGQVELFAPWVAVYLATVVEIGRRQRDLGAFPWWSALLYPVFAGMFVLVSALAVIERLRGAPVIWRGRAAVPGGESSR
jgi:cellulose synthase/poly-beta-1,6-N-acetylglucosamine synthase-like glycosyltransferase